MRALRLNILNVAVLSVMVAAGAIGSYDHWGKSASHATPWSSSYPYSPEEDGMTKVFERTAAADQKLTLQQRFEFDFATTTLEYRPPPTSDPIAHLIEANVPTPTTRPAMANLDEPATWVLVNDSGETLAALYATDIGAINTTKPVNLLKDYKDGIAPGQLAIFVIKSELGGCGRYLMMIAKSPNSLRARIVDVCSIGDRSTATSTFAPLQNVMN
jgi:hypothetical protein